MEEGAAATYERLEERRVRGDLEEWEQRALDHAAGLHDVLVRDGTSPRAAFAALCGNRYCAAPQCGSGAPPGAEYVVCLSEEEAANADLSVTPLLAFHLRISRKRHPAFLLMMKSDPPAWSVSLSRVAFSFGNCSSPAETAIQDCFLYQYKALKSVDFSGVRNVTSIGTDFLADCRCLEAVCLSAFSGVTTIESSFLSGCSALRSLSLDPLHSIRYIPKLFLYECSSLQELDFTALTNVEWIEHSAMELCTNLTKINLRGLRRVTRICNHFMTGCSSITKLDLSSLQSLEKIGPMFLIDCTALEDVRFDSLRSVVSVDARLFLWECNNLSPQSRASADEFLMSQRRREKQEYASSCPTS